MKLLTAKVVDGHLDIPKGMLQEGATITVLVPEDDRGFDLSPEQEAELERAIAEGNRGEGIDGWQLLQELRGS